MSKFKKGDKIIFNSCSVGSICTTCRHCQYEIFKYVGSDGYVDGTIIKYQGSREKIYSILNPNITHANINIPEQFIKLIYNINKNDFILNLI